MLKSKVNVSMTQKQSDKRLKGISLPAYQVLGEQKADVARSLAISSAENKSIRSRTSARSSPYIMFHEKRI